MKRFFVVSVPDKVEDLAGTEKAIADKIAEAGIDAVVLVLDDGWTIEDLTHGPNLLDFGRPAPDAGGRAPAGAGSGDSPG